MNDEEMAAATVAVTVAMARAFDEVWSRADARETMRDFLDGKMRFVVERDGIVMFADNPAATPPRVGLYL